MRIARFLLVGLVASCDAKASPAIQIDGLSDAIGSDVLTESIGLETLGGVFTPWLESGCPIPCNASYVFSTAEDGQMDIKITLFRGEGQFVSENVPLGTFKISGFDVAPRGEPQVNVNLEANSAGIFIAAEGESSGDLRITRID
jgi:molecular chaperone DnaK